MPSVRVRYTIDEAVVGAVEAIAKARKVEPSVVVEEAVRITLAPFPALAEAQELLASYAELLRELRSCVEDIHDHIRVVSRFVVDVRAAQGEDD